MALGEEAGGLAWVWVELSWTGSGAGLFRGSCGWRALLLLPAPEDRRHCQLQEQHGFWSGSLSYPPCKKGLTSLPG